MAYFLFARKILAGEPIRIFNNGDMYRDFTYIDDVVETIGRLMAHPPLPDENGAKIQTLQRREQPSRKPVRVYCGD